MLNKILVLIALIAAVSAGPVPESRIVGGYVANEGDYPYIVSLRWPSMRHLCGGSIISEHWVLSAAHCTIDFTPAGLFIVAGTIHHTGGANAVTHAVERIINHELYDDDIFAFDVCTIRVRDPFIWSRYIQPIRLGTEFVGAGVSAIAMGWGLTTQNRTDDGSDILLWHPTTTLTNADCVSQLGSWIIPQHLCTFSRLGQGICNGDSGGPLVAGDAVIGIATAVIPCARGWPDGWDRVAYFHSWIVANSVALPSRRIVGGYEANEGDFPYVVSLRWPNMRHFCGGSIISEHWVLSAAHCTIDSTPLSVFVVAGSIHINGGVNAKTHVVSRIINHEQYQPDVFAFDVCTIRVRDPFIWSRFIIPIRLATEFVGAGESATAMGWGMTTQDMSDDGSDILLWHSTTTISNLNCRLNLMPWILPQHLCTFSRIGQGICLGDSGGPLVINNAVVGIATAVIPCARGFPDGWDRVSTFHTWIIANSVG